jgi:TM2 domain-containing membrane protein YozV/RNA polymerase subunit RPABC4/transcription elongation factor Spt4
MRQTVHGLNRSPRRNGNATEPDGVHRGEHSAAKSELKGGSPMPIKTACPMCKHVITVPDGLRSSKVICPACSTDFLAWPGEGVAGDEPMPVVEAGAPTLPAFAAESATLPDRLKGEHEKFCHECGAVLRAKGKICPKCGVRQARHSGAASISTDRGDKDAAIRSANSTKIAAGICGILLGALGVHKFVLGLTTPGLIMFLVSILTCGIGAVVMAVIGLIEGIIYLTKSNEDFYQTYIIEKRGWF